MQVPVFRKAPWQELEKRVDEIHARNERESRQRAGGVQILVPHYRKTMRHGDWRWKELREGGILLDYLRRMRARTRDRWKNVGRARHGFQQNNRSDLQLLASVPAYDYFRFARLDKHFWSDRSNLKALRRDNPEVTTIYV